MKKQANFFWDLGVYGFSHVEPLIIAALVSEDPVLLIGKAGTGKTFLLNSISEAMGLEHRHYNASLISFDDLIGFPYPSQDGNSIIFLPTPATIWEAESVLVDELSRCKPETQNKFFSLIYERKIQGIALSKLLYRWAAMNPPTFENIDADDHYEGSMPLDQALADRFAFIIEVPDWNELTIPEQEAVINPAGEATISNDKGKLKDFVDKVKPEFLKNIKHPIDEVITYSRLTTTLMTEAGYRISPRRARLLSRNITALICVAKALGHRHSITELKDLYKLALKWSMPHRAWKGNIPEHTIDSVHSEACRLSFSNNTKERWLSEFLLKSSLTEKISMLFENDIDKDTKSLAVIQFLNRDSKARTAAFSFASFPLISSGALLNDEALMELAGVANGILNIDGLLEWKESRVERNTSHPGWSACLHVLNELPNDDENRKRRAKQLFLYLLTQKSEIIEPVLLEYELQQCFLKVKQYVIEYSK